MLRIGRRLVRPMLGCRGCKRAPQPELMPPLDCIWPRSYLPRPCSGRRSLSFSISYEKGDSIWGMRRALSTRSDDDVEYHEEVALMSERILDHRATPIGTFSPDIAESTIEAIGHWCSRGTFVVHSLTTAEKLFQRFVYELAAGNICARDKVWAIPELQEMLLSGWLRVDRRIGAERADLVLRSMTENYLRAKTNVKPSEEDFFAVMDKWLHTEEEHGAMKAASVLILLTDHPGLIEKSDKVSDWFDKILLGLTRSLNDESVPVAKLVLKRMSELHKAGWDGMQPSERVRDAVLNIDSATSSPTVDHRKEKNTEAGGDGDTFFVDTLRRQFEEAAKASDMLTADKVELMFKRLVSLSREGETGFTIDVSMYEHMLNFFCRVRLKDAATKATWLLQRMDQLIESGKMEGPLPGSAFDQVLSLWLKSNDTQALQRMQELFGRMKELQVAGKSKIKPSAQTYSYILQMWLKGAEDEMEGFHIIDELFGSWKDDAVIDSTVVMEGLARAAEELASTRYDKEANELINRAINLGFEPDLSVYQAIIRGHALAGHGLSSTRALELMERRHREGKTDERPDFACYECTILSLCRGKNVRVIYKMREVLNRFFDRYESGDFDCSEPSLQYFLESLLDLLKRYKRTDDAEAVLLRLEDMFVSRHGDFPLSTGCFNHAMKAFADRGDAGKVRDTFRRLLAHRDGAGRADLAPDAVSFGIYLRALSERGGEGDAEEATDALETLIGLRESGGAVRPDDGHLNSVLLLLKDVGDDGALSKACGLIERMTELGVRPSAFTFNTVLHAHMKAGGAGAAERAERLLERMIGEHEAGNAGARPEAFSFNAVVGALGRGGGSGAARRSLALLDRMEGLGVDPNAYTFNMLLDACARTRGGADEKRDALEVAVSAMVRLRRHPRVQPDDVTYSSLLKAYVSLLPRGADRARLVEAAFHMCRADGMLTETLMSMFQSILPPDVTERLLKDTSPEGQIP